MSTGNGFSAEKLLAKVKGLKVVKTLPEVIVQAEVLPVLAR